jgi:Cysteine rich repeat
MEIRPKHLILFFLGTISSAILASVLTFKYFVHQEMPNPIKIPGVEISKLPKTDISKIERPPTDPKFDPIKGNDVCDKENKKFCAHLGQTKALRCMVDHLEDLSEACAKTINATYRYEMKFCLDDIEAHCAKVKPGAGRVLKCLNDRSDVISRGCLNYVQSNL